MMSKLFLFLFTAFQLSTLIECQNFSMESKLHNPNGSFEAENVFAKCLVDRHNYYRKEGAGINEIQWNITLAEMAFKTAKIAKNKCEASHRQEYNKKNKVGENLWAGAYFPVEPSSDLCHYTDAAIKSWYQEIEFYMYPEEAGNFKACGTRGDPSKIHEVGHFALMMSDRVRSIGCSYAVCKSQTYIPAVPVPYVVVNCYYDQQLLLRKQVFDLKAANKMDKWAENEKYGGLPKCSTKPPKVTEPKDEPITPSTAIDSLSTSSDNPGFIYEYEIVTKRQPVIESAPGAYSAVNEPKTSSVRINAPDIILMYTMLFSLGSFSYGILI